MLDTFKEAIANQFEGVLCTLNRCLDQCPEPAWNGPVARRPFCQIAFHTLFFTDYYLERNAGSFREQAFHRENQPFFRDYEELEDREPRLLYDRASVKAYLAHCRTKASTVIAAETAETLTGESGFSRRDFSRAELHIYNLRHVHHHAAQLSLRLRIDAGIEIPWIGSGWTDL